MSMKYPMADLFQADEFDIKPDKIITDRRVI